MFKSTQAKSQVSLSAKTLMRRPFCSLTKSRTFARYGLGAHWICGRKTVEGTEEISAGCGLLLSVFRFKAILSPWSVILASFRFSVVRHGGERFPGVYSSSVKATPDPLDILEQQPKPHINAGARLHQQTNSRVEMLNPAAFIWNADTSTGYARVFEYSPARKKSSGISVRPISERAEVSAKGMSSLDFAFGAYLGTGMMRDLEKK
ncbi:hypothetical protein DFH07DRAFT_769294 [Mycena maculata]|uniref:Uncharacterized protein n=1 Tax=Mycena maculata TaxID=230809 RepID=A0AAD7JMJ6_9AGAR|nr:hypothetical protein DFH07DRAFT_769294 [Mycena maculata]